jgi:hypothetical protein
MISEAGAVYAVGAPGWKTSNTGFLHDPFTAIDVVKRLNRSSRIQRIFQTELVLREKHGNSFNSGLDPPRSST